MKSMNTLLRKKCTYLQFLGVATPPEELPGAQELWVGESLDEVISWVPFSSNILYSAFFYDDLCDCHDASTNGI